MNVVDARFCNSVEFEELEVGAVFYYPFGQWYGMVIQEADTDYNAINLQCGRLAKIFDYEKVNALNAQLTILS